MAKTTLPTNYVDDVLNGAMDGKRRYREIPNADGTISLEDVTLYDQIGSNFGAAQLNLMSDNINQSFDANKMLQTMDEVNAVTQEGYGVDALVVKQVNNSLVKTITLGSISDLATAMTTAIENNCTKGQGSFNFFLTTGAGGYCIQGYATPTTASGIITQQAMTNGWQFYHQFGGADTVLKKLGSGMELLWSQTATGDGTKYEANTISFPVLADYDGVVIKCCLRNITGNNFVNEIAGFQIEKGKSMRVGMINTGNENAIPYRHFEVTNNSVICSNGFNGAGDADGSYIYPFEIYGYNN